MSKPDTKTFTPSPVILDDLPDGQMLNCAQAAQAIGTNPATLSVWRCTKRTIIPYVKIGRRVVYRVGDLKQFMAERTVNGSDS
jgi:hypothetical protein